MAYGASLESWLGASPHGFESHILRCEKPSEQSEGFVISGSNFALRMCVIWTHEQQRNSQSFFVWNPSPS